MKLKKVQWFYVCLLIVFSVLLARLVMLTIVEGGRFKALAEGNRIKVINLAADRGVIYDRFGELLTRNTPEGREYIYSIALSQVLGYVGEVSEEELEMFSPYSMGDIIGKMGIEKEYDELLKGKDGGILVETDADGEVIREIGRSEPIAGKNLHVNLDAGLQRKAYELLDGRKGSVIASVPETGEILALVSSPGFDVNLFGLNKNTSMIDDRGVQRDIERVLNDKDLPMFNRAISGEYPPGSVFKIVTAVGALEEGKVDESTKIEDTGEIKIGIWRFGNWYYDQYGQKEGVIDIVRAISRSNDIFFYKLGEWLGIASLSDWAKYFGIGSQTGIDLGGEAYGLMPNPEWKKEYKEEDWYLGDTYISAIGQGDILMTPLQVNQMTGVIASKGKLCKPILLKHEAPDQIGTSNCKKLDISTKTLETVTEGMKQVCEAGGTAFPFFDFKAGGERVYVAGKTGTAEFGQAEDEETHAWMTVFAPVEKPEILVTVMLEEAGQGSYQAAPAAKELLDYWLGRQ